MSFIKYIADESHYKEVLSLVAKAKRTVWIGTADILTDDPEMVEAAIGQFDNVGIGKFCKERGRREYCSDPIK